MRGKIVVICLGIIQKWSPGQCFSIHQAPATAGVRHARKSRDVGLHRHSTLLQSTKDENSSGATGGTRTAGYSFPSTGIPNLSDIMDVEVETNDTATNGVEAASSTPSPTKPTNVPSSSSPINIVDLPSEPETSTLALTDTSHQDNTKALSEKAKPDELPGTSWNTDNAVKVQGGSLRTWSFATPHIRRIQVSMKTDGRPLNANVELWQGPENTPQKVAVYLENGSVRPFNCIIETPRGYNALAVRNTGSMEYPLYALLDADVDEGKAAGSASTSSSSSDKLATPLRKLLEQGPPSTVQGGGAVKSFAFVPGVASVQVLLQTDGRPLNARIELLQGPNNNKQVMEVYTDHGSERPFFVVIETPGSGNVVRVVNTSPIEYPMEVCVQPYRMETPGSSLASGGEMTEDGMFIVDGSH